MKNILNDYLNFPGSYPQTPSKCVYVTNRNMFNIYFI